jgi:hypothetical protein
MNLLAQHTARLATISALALTFTVTVFFISLPSNALANPQRSARKGPKRSSSGSVPSTAAARVVLEQRGKEEELFTVKSFRRLNGYSHGDGIYTIEFEAVVQCLKKGLMLLSPGDLACGEKGETVRYSDAVALQKTENGWRAVAWGSDAKMAGVRWRGNGTQPNNSLQVSAG